MWQWLQQDLLYALRGIRRNASFAVTATLTLALGIGGVTAMFTIVRAVLLKPLNYVEPDRLVQISGGATPTRYQELRDSAPLFSGIGAYAGAENLTLVGNQEAEILTGARVSANFLTTLGIKPLIGRGFEAREDEPGAAPVALISQRFWQRHFHSDQALAGKVVTLSGIDYGVVGVMPAQVQFPYAQLDVWMTQPSEWPQMVAQSRRLSPFLSLFGRLNKGVTLVQANSQVAMARQRYGLEHPAMLDAKSKSPVEVKLMKDELVTNVSSMLWMLFGAVSFVLLITCANIAGLMLARSKSRAREFAVRSAIGASRWRLLIHLLAESVLLSIIGGTMGLALAELSLHALPLLSSFQLPRTSEIQVDWFVLLFALVVSICTGILFGLLPALGASRPDLIGALRGSGAAATFRKSPARNILVAAQIALSMVLLVGAALMIESVIRLRDVNIGFNPASLITARIDLPARRYDSVQKQSSFYKNLLERLKGTPGVRGATASMTLPMQDAFAGTPVQDAAKPLKRLNERLIAIICIITPDYFATLGIPLRRGKSFSERDKEGAERVAVIDEALAKKFWPQFPGGLDPVGQRIFVGGVNPNPARIIGIVPTIRQNLENTAWPETVYVSLAQSPPPSAMVAVHTLGDPHRFTTVLRKTVQSLDNSLALVDVHSMEDLMDVSVGERRLIVDLLGLFAAISMLLALIGIYGTISYSVAGRKQEMAIRSSLGANKQEILKLVLNQGLILSGCGIAAGLFGSYWLTQALKKLLYGVSATDPLTFGGMAVLFLLAALLASYFPARRAAHTDPIAALRF